MVEFNMPKLGLTMEEGTIVEWHKQVGDAIKDGDLLLSVETDKATLDVEAEQDGVLLAILLPAGGQAPVGAPIARIGNPGEVANPTGQTTQPASAGQQSPDPKQAADSQQAAVTQPHPVPTAPEPIGLPPGGRILASPVVRKLARLSGLDLRSLKGSGPGGRIVLRDLPAQIEQMEAQVAGAHAAPPVVAPLAPPVPTAIAAAPPMGVSGRIIALTPMRRAIAATMTLAAAIPQFRVSRTVDVSQTLAVREQLKPFLEQAQVKLSLTDFLIQASALALAAHPEVNASFVPSASGKAAAIQLHDQANIGLAVAVPGGLVVPVLHAAETLLLADIARRREQLVHDARLGRLSAQKAYGATFTLSNLGPMGVDQFDAIVTPPQAAALAVGSVMPRPVAERWGEIVTRPTIILTITADHRVIDGLGAAAFLGTIARLLTQANEYRIF